MLAANTSPPPRGLLGRRKERKMKSRWRCKRRGLEHGRCVERVTLKIGSIVYLFEAEWEQKVIEEKGKRREKEKENGGSTVKGGGV